MRQLYTFLFYCSLPFIFLRLWRKGKKIPDYRLRWAERLGFIPDLSAKNTIWLHAVSMGELIAARPLILGLRKQYPDKTLVITTTTVSGSNLAQQYVSDKIYHCYLPYDLPGPIHRFLDRVRPTQAIIMETELWPNLLHATAKRSIPVLLANARLSDISMKSYLRIVWLTREMMANITCIAAQTQDYANRFIKLGAKPEQIRVMGNIKFDVPVPTQLVEKGKALRHDWALTQRPVVIAASTHHGEEEIVLQAFKNLLTTHHDALLIIVPRHPERFDEVAVLCEKQGHQVIRRSQNQPCTATTQIFLGDSMGELFLYYAMADVAFVGGSFVSVGGHNPLEPAAVCLPVLTGTQIFNFTEIYALMEKAGAAMEVQDAAALADAWHILLADAARCEQMGKAGEKVVVENKGAVEKHLNYLAETKKHH